MSVFSRRRAATRLGRYWNARVGGGISSQRLATLSIGIDQDLLEQIDVVRRAHDLQAPDPEFVTRLEHELLRSLAKPSPSAEEPFPWIVDPGSRLRSGHRHPRLSGRDLGQWSGRRLGAWAGAAVVVLLVLVGALAVTFDDPEPKTLPFRAVEPSTPSAMAPVPTVSPHALDALNGIAEPLWVSPESGPGAVSEPGFVNIDPEGRIWASDDAGDAFRIYAPDGTFLESWGGSGAGPGQFAFATLAFGENLGDVAFAGDGSFYVTDCGNRRVQAFDADRRFAFQWGDAGDGTADGQFICPASIAIAPDGTILVSDFGRNDVQRFASDGTYIDRFETPINRSDQFNGAGAITITPDGAVWVAGVRDGRIHRFDSGGGFLGMLSPASREVGGFVEPWEVAFDADGNAHVVDFGRDQILVFSPEGTYLNEWGSSGPGIGQLWAPRSIVISGDTAYVQESRAGRLQVFRIILPMAPTSAAATPAS